MDYLAIAVHELGNISERRTEVLTNEGNQGIVWEDCIQFIISPLGCSKGLPAFLVAPKSKDDDGLNSGFMIAQYTAAALGKPWICYS